VKQPIPSGWFTGAAAATHIWNGAKRRPYRLVDLRALMPLYRNSQSLPAGSLERLLQKHQKIGAKRQAFLPEVFSSLLFF
jgi:hypothetical protein